MPQAERERRESVSVELEGRTYTGTMVITGTRKLRFLVEYGGMIEGDPQTYKPGAEDARLMRKLAEHLLLRLLSEERRRKR